MTERKIFHPFVPSPHDCHGQCWDTEGRKKEGKNAYAIVSDYH